MDVETTQTAAACLGIGTVILCRRKKKKKNVESEKSGCSDFLLLELVVRRTCIKEAVCLCLTAYVSVKSKLQHPPFGHTPGI